ncbi:CBS domain-containing protein [Haloarculaceae archaeon H-GB2-1]|nr:CBS domain-containing protein [Haloarculaceae archaeon H-GB1-1]MEA5386971.1 CBS domain-containing protein [Haloarculaceae archaeon H-GB11]MEA5408473.1 CBS domain-containing protein [Haloarculaceae archaeon H-GB2-1]
MLIRVTVREVMKPDVVTVVSSKSVRDVANLVFDRDLGSVAVTENGDTVGIVTKTDLVGCLAKHADADAVTAGDIMTTPVVTISPSATIERAATKLRDNDVKQLLVTEDGELAGVVTVTHLSYYLPQLAIRSTAEPEERHGRRAHSGPGLLYEDVDWETEFVCEDEDRVLVGDTVRFSKPLTDQDVFDFAQATGDTNRLHLDEAYANETRFGRRIAHGVLTVGVVSAALARLPGLVIYLSQQASFVGPVDIGDRVTAECRVIEDLDGDRFRLQTNVRDEDGNTVLDGEATVIVDQLPESERRERAAAPGS